MIDIEAHKNFAISKFQENKTFLNQLKKKKPKDLDTKAKEFHDEVFTEIDCLECGNCCRGTGPLFIEKDIERVSKSLKMKEGDFANQYLRKDEEGDWVFKSVPCPFLGDDNYCFIYENRPRACREFPHTDRRKLYQINNLTIKNIEICPAAYKIIQKLKEHYQF
ncbi:YkgJ family cysteine cluster protein [Weeksellaceae bacterium TAE3-ERU29]|nr:YkgJ family cysteine cluster protein [Weeksellaceae bacterium TAE3-ERU29]